MKRILLPLSLLALLLFAVGLLFTTASQNVASSNAATVEQSSDTHASDAPIQAKGTAEARSSGQAKVDRDRAGEADLPAALGRHLEKLMETIPGDGGEGPASSAAEWRFMARAYPDTDISLDKIEGARAAHALHLARGFASTNAAAPAASTWVSLGPSSALYPLSVFRTSNNYVPNAYLAGGRTTALAIDPGCIPGNCRLWATPAGGGVWRTDDALKAQPVWTYLSSSFAINAAGSIRSTRTTTRTCGSGLAKRTLPAIARPGLVFTSPPTVVIPGADRLARAFSTLARSVPLLSTHRTPTPYTWRPRGGCEAYPLSQVAP